MKKGLKIILPVLVCLLLVGSGFSIWYFTGEANKTGSISGNVDVTDPSALVSTLTIKEAGEEDNLFDYDTDGATKNNISALAITLDQGANKTSPAELIYFGTNTKTSIDLVFVATISGDSSRLATARFDVNVSLTTELDEYINAIFVATVGAEGENGVVTSTVGDTKTITIYRTLSFQYEEDMKPESSQEYDDMVTALGDNQKVTLTAVVSES